MRKFVFLIIALLVGVLSAFGASGYRNLMSTEARKLVEQKKNLYLLDVRTQDEFRQAHLKGSVLIPINEIERRLGEVPRNRPILVLCAVGSRSNLVAGFLSSKGYGEVYNLQDGLMGWYRNGYPIER